MNWNLVWTSIDKSTGEFVVLLGDEPILTKKMYGQIINGSSGSYLTFVENSYKFSFENFNEFVNDFDSGKQAKISFDVWDGEDAIAYDEDNESLNIELSSYTSNLKFSIGLNEKTRSQFASEFRKFLNHWMEFFESELKNKNSNSTIQQA